MYRISQLLASGQKMFHTADLAVIWGISDKNTLYTTIKRYVAKKVLFTIHKGFYSLIPTKDLDLYVLGVKFLHRYAYVSTETVLSQEGVIFQAVYPITLVSDVSRKFQINGQDYICRKMKNNRLLDSTGITNKNNVLFAEKKRAVSDMLYFNPKYHFDKKI